MSQEGIMRKYQLIGDFLVGLDSPLGGGSQGQVFYVQDQVYEGKNIYTNESVAVKKFLKENPKIGDQDKVKQLFNMEVKILKACKERQIPNIIEYIDHLETDHHYILILELCEQSLDQYLKGHGQIPENQTIQWISQIVGAMKTYDIINFRLHSLGFCHRDLKPENIVIKDDQVKIIDLSFGRSMPAQDQNILIQSQQGTKGYAAPEIYKGFLYSPFLSDVYSLGVVFYEMLFGKQGSNKIFDFPKTPVINLKTETLIKSMIEGLPQKRADWHEVSSALQQYQPLISTNLSQSSIYYSEKWQKDIQFLLSIIEDSSALGIQIIECTPCLLLINKIAIDKVEKKIINLGQQQDEKIKGTIENLEYWLKTLYYQLGGQIRAIQNLYNEFKEIKQPISEMKDELKNELSNDYKSKFKNQVKYFLNYVKGLRYSDINSQFQVSKLQLKLIAAYDYESDFENVKTLLLQAKYEIQENLIDYLNRLFKQERTQIQHQKILDMIAKFNLPD